LVRGRKYRGGTPSGERAALRRAPHPLMRLMEGKVRLAAFFFLLFVVCSFWFVGWVERSETDRKE